MAKKTAQEKVVRSDLAEPTRPKGHDGVRQPIQLDEPSFPPPEPPPDAEIAAAVREIYAADGRVPDHRITVGVHKAVVELKGEVELEFHRTLAAALAESVPGVLAVTNELAVSQ